MIGIGINLLMRRQGVVTPPVLLGSMDITDGANQASFTRSVAAGYTGATGSAFAFEKQVDELRDDHHAGGSVGVLLEDSPTPCALPAPANLSFGANGINLNVSGSWDAVTGSVAKYQYRYDGAGAAFDVTPDDTATSLTTTGTAGTHTVQIRAVSPSGVAGAWSAPSGNIVLVGSAAAVSGSAAWFKDAPGANNTAIASWPDASGNSRDATQATGASQPLTKTGILNGLPIARFDAVNDFLKTADFSLAQPYTVQAVFKFTANGSGQAIFDGLADFSSTAYMNSAGDELREYAGVTVPTPVTDGAWHILTVIFNGASSSIQIDNNTAATGDAGGGNAGGITLGATGGGTFFGLLDLAELIVYPSVLSGGNIAANKTYFATKFSL